MRFYVGFSIFTMHSTGEIGTKMKQHNKNMKIYQEINTYNVKDI